MGPKPPTRTGVPKSVRSSKVRKKNLHCWGVRKRAASRDHGPVINVVFQQKKKKHPRRFAGGVRAKKLTVEHLEG